VEGLDGDAQQLHHLGGDDEHPGARRGCGGGLPCDTDDGAGVVADPEAPSALSLDGQHAGIAEVDDV
jgi:hypothetical protein